MSPLRLVALILSSITLALCGCGGGTATTAVSMTTSGNANASRTSTIANANTICKRLHAQLRAFSAHKLSVEQSFGRAATYEQATLAKLRQLSVPPALNADWNQVLNALSTVAADSAKYAEDAKTKHLGAAASLAATYGPIKRPAVAVAMHDGLTECGLVL